MLQYLWLTERSWQKLPVGTLERGAEFLYAWCHQPELETAKGGFVFRKSLSGILESFGSV